MSFRKNFLVLLICLNFQLHRSALNIGSFNDFENSAINIGLLTENVSPAAKIIFNKAIEDANLENYGKVLVNGKTENVNFGDPLDISNRLCNILNEKLVAVIGPVSPSSADQALSICDAKEMPFLDIRWDFDTQLPTINLHPHPSQLAAALKDLTTAFEWRGFTILYESGDYLPLVTELLELYGPLGPTVTVRKFDLNLNNNYRPVLRRVKKSGDTSLVVLASTANLPRFFEQAQQIGLVTDSYSYIVGDLDFQTIDLESYQYGEANITSIRVVSPENEKVQELIGILQKYPNIENLNVTCPISVSLALIYDGVQLLAQVLQTIMPQPVQLNCDDAETWNGGYSLVNYITTGPIVEGISGDILFDNQGLRSDFEIEIIELTTAGITKVGTWTSKDGLDIDRGVSEPDSHQEDVSLEGKHFTVITALSDPYGMLKDTPDALEGNEQFEGFGIELIEELSKKLKFKYTFRLQEDNRYGSKDPATGKWDGMILEILEDRADLGITDLTMTSDRESAVDFTIPFMNLGIAILYRKPKKDPPKLFSFMSPFSGEVWLYLGVAYLSVSFSLFVLGRLSPAEWDNPYPCIEEPTELENQFSFANSLWFSIGALLQQGSEIAPKASSTRAVASTWWFFTLILVSSYTANLAAFLTVESLNPGLADAEDLASGRNKVSYGAKKGGSTFKFFEDATYPTFQKMYEYMRDHPEYQPSTNTEGVNLVENTNYAFLMESTSIEYTIERKCTLAQVGNLLDEKGYGIAMRKNWPYRDALSKAILELQEQGVLTKMKTKWWKEKRGGGACSDTGGDSGGAVALEIDNLGGVFLVLIIGSCFAVLISIVEMIVEVKKLSDERKTLFRRELLDELKFVLKCKGNTKIVKRNSPTNSSRNSSISFNSVELSNNDEFKFRSEDDSKLSKQFFPKNS